MKLIKRIYYLMFYRPECFKNTLQERITKWGNHVQCGDRYLGNDWWLRKVKRVGYMNIDWEKLSLKMGLFKKTDIEPEIIPNYEADEPGNHNRVRATGNCLIKYLLMICLFLFVLWGAAQIVFTFFLRP